MCDSRLLPGTRENRDRAHRFLETIAARGGTELTRGFQKAVELLERGGGDVLILTDGQVAGTERILAEARQTNTRLHCLGIGSASQDRFLALLARGDRRRQPVRYTQRTRGPAGGRPVRLHRPAGGVRFEGAGQH